MEAVAVVGNGDDFEDVVNTRVVVVGAAAVDGAAVEDKVGMDHMTQAHQDLDLQRYVVVVDNT